MHRLAAGPFLVLILVAATVGQEVDKPIKGTLQIGVHELALAPDFAYEITCSAKKYRHLAMLSGADSARVPADFSGDPNGLQVSKILCSPAKKCKVELRVTPASDLPAGPHEYLVEVKRHKINQKPIFEAKGKITAKDRVDPGRGNNGIGFPVKLTKGRLYVVEVSPDSKKQVVEPGFWRKEPPEEFSAFGFENIVAAIGSPVRCVFQAKQGGQYLAMAEASVADGDVSFSLRVYETKY